MKRKIDEVYSTTVIVKPLNHFHWLSSNGIKSSVPSMISALMKGVIDEWHKSFSHKLNFHCNPTFFNVVKDYTAKMPFHALYIKTLMQNDSNIPLRTSMLLMQAIIKAILRALRPFLFVCKQTYFHVRHIFQEFKGLSAFHRFLHCSFNDRSIAIPNIDLFHDIVSTEQLIEKKNIWTLKTFIQE